MWMIDSVHTEEQSTNYNVTSDVVVWSERMWQRDDVRWLFE